MSLYSKYRPKDWNSVVGQDLIVTILRTSIETHSTSHAYIFTGSRGTGKTTSARILAKSLNCQNLQNGNPCHECEYCKAFDSDNFLDVIEIDGASNTGVENVRDLIEKAKFEPTQGQYKIYIIDEVHMLSTGAFNALLKTLEEPPKHVKFILATTEIHKVPETVQSRAHRFDFHKISLENLVKRLQFVCEHENIVYEPKTLEIIAKMSRGGMRDALTILEQYTINQKISLKHLEESFSLIDDILLQDIIETLKNKNISHLKDIIKSIKEKHINIENFFDQILFLLRDKMFDSLGSPDIIEYGNIAEIFKKAYSSIKIIPNSDILLEITLFQAISRDITPINTENLSSQKQQTQIQTPINTTPIIEITKDQTKSLSSHNNTNTDDEFIKQLEDQVRKNQKDTPTIKTNELSHKTSDITQPQKVDFNFRTLLGALTTKPVILNALKTASFNQNENNLTLSFSSNWHYSKINELKHATELKATLTELFGGEWIVTTEHKPQNIDTSYVDEVF